MKKAISLVVLLFLVTGVSLTNAQYVRKVKEPDFFIPDQFKMHKAEKIPQRKIKQQNIEEQEALEENNVPIAESNLSEKMNMVEDNKINEIASKISQNSTKETLNTKEQNKEVKQVNAFDNYKEPQNRKTSNKPNKFLHNIKEVPAYKNKYNEYINDIMSFYSNDKMPENIALENDLSAMNSDEKIEITAPAPTELKSKEMSEFYSIYQKMMKD